MRYIFFLFLFILFSCKPTMDTRTSSTPSPPLVDKSEILKDYDKDGVPDKYDLCPTIMGSQENRGCPNVEEDCEYKSVVKSDAPVPIDLEEIIYLREERIKNKRLSEERIKNKRLTKERIDKRDLIEERISIQPKEEVRPKGLIAYSVPDQMEVGQEYSVKVRISKQNDRTVLLVGDREIPISDNLDSVKVESITVSPIMSASLLSSKKDFEITPLSTDIQNIEENGYTEWEWNVSPLQGGENNLKLNVKIRIKEDGNDYYKDITVFERKIKVKSNLGSSIKDFVFNNWEWFMGAIFIPLFQWLWLLWKRKKEEKDV